MITKLCKDDNIYFQEISLYFWCIGLIEQAEVLREVDGGAQRVSVDLPAVISADLRLNEPRFATLQNIMKARKKKIEEIAIEDLGVNIESTLEYLQVNEPPVRKGGALVDSVEELFQKMKEHECL